MKQLLVFAVTSVLSISANAGDTYYINYVDKAPVIDSFESDEAWNDANTLTQFTFPWDTKMAPATEFKAVWNEKAIYFRYRVKDKNVTLGEGERGALDSDRVEIFLSTDDKLTKYYTMEIDAKDQIYSAIGTYDAALNKRTSLTEFTWPNLTTSSKLTETGYIVEGSIPMKTLENLNLLKGADKSELICALMRAEFTKTSTGIDMGWIAWNDPQLPVPNFHNPRPFGTCKLVGK
ncbi:hypothetical protein VA249_41350 [Vibrio alfacsensis]|uniref:carbohydrate-binding family 9-like protein n=1 Tax=Vibrio alfacsensis TaxID=1074311 RepID=UPI001BF13913|nr:carbohydrate-binding family 9-like protein [Vibrio alfacsensis]BBM67489.1 hypothetical protein VA249_41350 [Vibrio alfacsensis]